MAKTCPKCGKPMNSNVATNKSDDEMWVHRWCTKCEYIENECLTCKGGKSK